MRQFAAVFLCLGLAAAQTPEPEPPPPPPPPPPPFPVVMPGVAAGNVGFISHEFSMQGSKPVTGAPYSAEQVTEHIQTLADGNRIVNTSSTRMYRDGQGRTRTEMSLPPINLGSNPPVVGIPAPAIVTINDPVAGETYMLNSDTKNASKMPGGPKVVAEAFTLRAVPGIATAGPVLAQAIKISDERAARGDDVSKEDLGTQQIEGVKAIGTRYTNTIPAGAIGNEQPIQTVSETWYSPDLKVTLKSINSDPRTGVTTLTVKNLNRAEPDPSLFQVPSDYTVTDSKNGAFFLKSDQQK